VAWSRCTVPASCPLRARLASLRTAGNALAAALKFLAGPLAEIVGDLLLTGVTAVEVKAAPQAVPLHAIDLVTHHPRPGGRQSPSSSAPMVRLATTASRAALRAVARDRLRRP
jgi:hypothetical protein